MQNNPISSLQIREKLTCIAYNYLKKNNSFNIVQAKPLVHEIVISIIPKDTLFLNIEATNELIERLAPQLETILDANLGG